MTPVVGRRRAGRASGASSSRPAFRPSPTDVRAAGPSRAQTAALLAGVLVVAVAIAVASFAVKPATARSFQLLYGSVFIDDNLTPVAVDLASGRATVRLSNAAAAVTATHTEDLDMVPLQGGTLMLDAASGEFNMLDSSGFVLKPTGGGVRLPQLAGSADSTTIPVASGDSAYLVRSNATGTAVYLVGQSTVASAVGVTTGVKARAQATLRAPTAGDPDEMTSANGQLWLLSGGGTGTRHIEQLSVPRGSNAGVPLTVRTRGSVTGVAALATATTSTGGGSVDAVAVATANAVRVFGPGSAGPLTVRVPGLSQADAISPVRDAQNRFAFLYHAGDTWTLVRVPPTGGTAEVHPVKTLAGVAGIVSPVESNGRVYTLTRTDPARLLQIGTDGTGTPISGVPDYPIVNRERLDLRGAELTAAGSRVIFNSRANFKAVVVFSDGSHAPRVILKHSAVQVDTNGSASITGDENGKQRTPPKQNKPQPRTQPAINNKINCKVASQTPHIPQVQIVQRASRSVQLQWEYPLLDPQDCDPSTYTVAVQAVTSGAPQPPGLVPVQGQDGVVITGLFPDTTYQFVVTAYINKLHTSAPPISATTSIEGPAAPTRVRTSVDNAGNWTITWNSCGGVSNGCVPTADWQIVPHLCDGVGLSANPDTRRRVGDPTQHTFSFTYQGSAALLGRGLSFDVEGIGEKGTIGDSASDNSCQYSWSPTVPADISVHPSAPPKTTGETTTHTDVTVEFTNGQQHDLGGVGGQLTYELLSNGAVVDKVGPTTKPQMTIQGISAGQKYQVAVLVNPPRHPEASERIGPVDVQAATAIWPVPSVAASFEDGSAYNGTLSVTVSMPAGTDVHGETFDLVNSELRCGNTTYTLDQDNLRPGQQLSFGPVDRTSFNSQGTTCRVTAQLMQDDDTATDPPLYGDGTSSHPAQSGPITIDPPSLTAGADDFDAKWVNSTPDNPQIAVGYSGNDSQFLVHAKQWNVHLTNGSGNCGTAQDAPSPNQPAVVIDVDKGCIEAGGDLSASVTFDWYGKTPSFSVDVQGSGPQPVDPGKLSFTAAWDTGLLGLGKPVVQIQHFDAGGYAQSDLDALAWTWKVTSNGVTCGSSHEPPSASNGGLEDGSEIHVTFDICPRTQPDGTPNDYTLTANYHDPNYGGVPDFPPVDLGPLN